MPDPDATPTSEARAVAAAIASGFRGGSLDLAGREGAPAPGWDAMPEFRAAEAIRRAGANDLDVRLALTFGAALDAQRDSDRLWDAVAAFFADCRWAFSPEQVSRRPLAELRETLKAAGVSQRHVNDSRAWRGIATSLLDPASPRPCAAPSSRPRATRATSSPRCGADDGSRSCAGRRSR